MLREATVRLGLETDDALQKIEDYEARLRRLEEQSSLTLSANLDLQSITDQLDRLPSTLTDHPLAIHLTLASPEASLNPIFTPGLSLCCSCFSAITCAASSRKA